MCSPVRSPSVSWWQIVQFISAPRVFRRPFLEFPVHVSLCFPIYFLMVPRESLQYSSTFPVHSSWVPSCAFPSVTPCVSREFSLAFSVHLSWVLPNIFLVRFSVHSLCVNRAIHLGFPCVARTFPRIFSSLCFPTYSLWFPGVPAIFEIFAVASFFVTPRVSYALN